MTDTITLPRETVQQALCAAFDRGFLVAAEWANRDDLQYDQGSKTYKADREQSLTEFRAALQQAETQKSGLHFNTERSPKRLPAEPFQNATRMGEHAVPTTPMEQFHYLAGKIDGKLEAYNAEPQAQCRQDGRCQYAIDHGAEGLGQCPPGKCAMPQAQDESAGSKAQQQADAELPEPQAQIGETSGLSCRQLEVQRNHWQDRCVELSEAIAKKDAALKACVGAMHRMMKYAAPVLIAEKKSPSNAQWMVEEIQNDEDTFKAAITQAQGAMK